GGRRLGLLAAIGLLLVGLVVRLVRTWFLARAVLTGLLTGLLSRRFVGRRLVAGLIRGRLVGRRFLGGWLLRRGFLGRGFLGGWLLVVVADHDAHRVERRDLVGPLHHRNAVRAVTGPRGALGDTGLRQVRHLDGDGVRLRAATAVLRGHEERGHRRGVDRLVGGGEHPARGVEVTPGQAVLGEERRLQVVAARRSGEEPVADQVAGAHPQL